MTGAPPQQVAHPPNAMFAPLAWRLPKDIHPLVRSMPAEVESSIASLGAYLREREPNPYRRTKAIHDWQVTRICYGWTEYKTDRIGIALSDPEMVFRNRRGVCDGFSRLFAKLAAHAGIRAERVVGKVHLGGTPWLIFSNARYSEHAWNVVHINGRSHLLDVTWDAPVVERDPNETHRTKYLFTPPEVFFNDHFPDDARYQLLPQGRTLAHFQLQHGFPTPAIDARAWRLPTRWPPRWKWVNSRR